MSDSGALGVMEKGQNTNLIICTTADTSTINVDTSRPRLKLRYNKKDSTYYPWGCAAVCSLDTINTNKGNTIKVSSK